MDHGREIVEVPDDDGSRMTRQREREKEYVCVQMWPGRYGGVEKFSSTAGRRMFTLLRCVG